MSRKQSSPQGGGRKEPFKLPHALVLIYVLVVLTWAATLVLPSGQFKRVEKQFEGKTRLVAEPGTYTSVEKKRLGPEWVLLGPVKGFEDGIQIIAFCFIIGGAFFVVQKTRAVEGGIQRMSQAFSRNPKLRRVVIPVLMTVFSLAGGIFGMSEETIPFVAIFIPLAISMGYDSLVGVSIPFLGAAAGFAAAFFNPFTVGVAQGFCNLPVYSGLPYRLVLWVLGTAIVIAYVMWYAEKVRLNPQSSPVYDIDQQRVLHATEGHFEEIPWGEEQRRVLTVLALGMVALVVGILQYGWYIPEIAALFLALGIMCGFIGNINPSEIAAGFVEGAKDMMNVAFVIACGRAILIIMKEGQVLDTVLQMTASTIGAVPAILTAQIMFISQAVINFFIHSGTAQAALTMPIMSPLADLVGVTRQTTVLAFQLCEFVNPILPTSAVTMGVLGMAKIPWERWARWFLPLMLILVVFSLLALVPPVLVKWGPF